MARMAWGTAAREEGGTGGKGGDKICLACQLQVPRVGFDKKNLI
eukprot:CAMPEP_0172443392 /NCGR_PEP_ID=MMETSP1065-20121228/3668_1 /TAXON_ID=265537 /ORGANISM="Amphiprora paludosa, Strain CCMP125" /LENGTH=43 /DNA_ID= /DNA_START= /DNA_END= /DNA_ORIENTATION=